MEKKNEANFFKSLKFVKQCREEGLSLWECPNFLFVFTGIVSLLSISGTYYLASYYFPPEVVIIWIGFVSFVMIVISFLVNQGMTKITQAKKILKENNQELERALQESRKAKKMQEDFTTMLVHDMRSPLEAVRMIIELLTEQDQPVPGKEIIKAHQSIDHSVTNMLNLITNLLDVAKFDRGKFVIHKQLGDIRSNISIQKENFKVLAAGKGIKLNSQIADNLPSVPYDEYAINRVIANLLVNAIKFTPANGEITMQAVYVNKGKHIKEIAERSGIKWLITPDSPQILDIKNSVLVAVTDNGIGIAEQKIDKLFLSFSQVINTQGRLKTGIPIGTGLGLSIAKVIIEGNDGIINVESVEDGGSTFYFTLPTA
ncbi:HAMP domain-containing histidine kinase [Patescibacteria group bacterium]|nr:HAMP domain-containing histidine kinase [Patescibacteria group bacterium]MBU1951535.1 HAMP domain-containing histidine kinase [Patescibacteria group bacterium]MBU2229532.1 HAMP domain-containing histidine kinase [Patescibacteria group bacterium]